jgi:hypothetical protein
MRSRLHKMLRGLAAGPFAEPVMGLTAFMVGIALALPNDTFSRSSFNTMAALAAEWGWAIIFVTAGAGQLTAALLEVKGARLATSMVGGTLWMVWTAATLHSGFGGVLWAFGVAMVLGQALAYLRAKALA